MSVFTGKVDVFGAARSLLGAAIRSDTSSLSDEVADKLAPYAKKLTLILSERDGTAIAAQACWKGPAFDRVRSDQVISVATDAHTFAREGDHERLVEAVIEFLQRMSNES